MSRFVRPSKYRHVYGTAAKKEVSYDNVKVSNNAWDTNLVSGNGSYIAVNWAASGGGAFCIIPTARTGKLPDIYPLCRGHTAPVLDTAFSPHDDSFVASASDDGTIGLWKVQDDVFDVLDLSEKERENLGGVKDMQPEAKLSAGGRKVGQVLFHPTASNVLAASTGEHVVKLFDVTSASSSASLSTPKATLSGFTDTVQSLSWDWAGNTLVATSRDRKLRTFDARKGGDAVQTAESHGGIKGARVVWCGNSDRIVTTGFSKMSDRQLFLWDSKNLTKPIKSITLDSSSGVIMPFWSDNNILFLAGKGDGNIRYYELESDELHYLTEYKSVEPQRGLTFVPRRCLNANDNEIARAYKVTGNMVQPISFLVPRRAESFQADIFPPAPSATPALDSAAFFGGGKKSDPNLVSLEDGKNLSESAIKRSAPAAAPAPTPAASAAPAPSPAAEPIKSTPAAPPATSAAPSRQATSELPAPTRTTTAPAPKEATAPAPEPAQTPSLPAPSCTATLAASPTTTQAPSLQTNGHAGGSNADSDKLAAELAKVKLELDGFRQKVAQRDATIRELEIENEKLKTNQQRMRDALGV